MSWGPLRFVDSMNVFPTSLASMIDNLRACTHKQLPELFPLMASLHPELQLRTPTPPQRRPLKQRRTLRAGAGVGLHPAQAAHALRALLRRRGVGDVRGVGAALLQQRAGGEGGEQRTTGWPSTPPTSWDLPRVPRLLPPHRRPGPGGRDGELPGLLLGAVGARPHPLRHAARGRLGRHAAALETPIHLITDEQAYKDVRASVMGGLSCIFPQANNPELGEEDYNPEEPVNWISYLDFNAMYPAAMTLPMPNGPYEAVARRKTTQRGARDVPLEPDLGVRRRGGELPAPRGLRLPPGAARPLGLGSPARMKVGKGLYGPHTADMAERLGLSPSPCEKLVPFLGMHVEEGVDGKRLKFLRDVLGQGLEAAQGLPLRLQPLHGGLHGAQAQRAEAAQDRGCREGGEAHPERYLRPLLHEPRQVQEHERLRGPGQV